MTQNQIAYANYKENQRHNMASEQETVRHNTRGEDLTWSEQQETKRSNLAREGIELGKLRNEVDKLNETRRSNLAREQETIRSNLARESETQRSNIARESETASHNRETERLASAKNSREQQMHDVTLPGAQIDAGFDTGTGGYLRRSTEQAGQILGSFAKGIFSLSSLAG